MVLRSEANLLLTTNASTLALKLDTSQNATFAGDVLVGSSSGNAKLEVVENITFSTVDTFGQFIIKSTGGSTGNMMNFGVDEAGGFGFLQSVNRGIGVTPLVLQRYAGNVGIGETGPASSLVVRKDTAAGRGGEISIVNYAAGGTPGIGNEAALNFGLENSTYHGDAGNAQIKAIVTASNNKSDMVFSTWNGSAFGERMLSNADGNVGIGVTSPGPALEVYGTVRRNYTMLDTGNNNANSEISY